MYPGWSARDNYAQTKETANNNSASFTLFLSFIFVELFAKVFVSKRFIFVCAEKEAKTGEGPGQWR